MNDTNKSPQSSMQEMKPKGAFQRGRPSPVQNFLAEVLVSSLNQAFTRRNSPTRPEGAEKPKEVFETHEYIFIRVPIPNRVSKNRIVIHVSASRVTVRWSPEGARHVYQLPENVMIEGAEASVKDSVLEIKMPKELNPDTMRLYVN